MDTQREHSSQRAQALATGALIDVTVTAEQAGFRSPVAITKALWEDIQNIPAQIRGLVTVKDRIWELLFLGCSIAYAQRWQGKPSDCIEYLVIMPVGTTTNRKYAVRLMSERGDDGETVLTLAKCSEAISQSEKVSTTHE